MNLVSTYISAPFGFTQTSNFLVLFCFWTLHVLKKRGGGGVCYVPHYGTVASRERPSSGIYSIVHLSSTLSVKLNIYRSIMEEILKR